MSEILCVGIAVADAIGRPIDTVPEKARLQLFDRMELHTGGCAVNTGIALARLGADVGVACKVGTDGFGDFLEKELRGHGVDTRGLVRDDEVSTSFTFIMVASDGERRFLHTYGANATFCFDDVDLDLVRQARFLHVAGSYLLPTLDGEQTAAVLREARAAGATTSLDTAFNDRVTDWLGLMAPCFEHLDYFLPSIEEAEKISGLSDPGDMARSFIERGCRNVVIKLGREGSMGILNGVEVRKPIYQVQTVDSSGAGDCFVAGFLTAIHKGWGPEESLSFGNAVAATCVQAIGCTAGVRSLDETRRFQASFD